MYYNTYVCTCQKFCPRLMGTVRVMCPRYWILRPLYCSYKRTLTHSHTDTHTSSIIRPQSRAITRVCVCVLGCVYACVKTKDIILMLMKAIWVDFPHLSLWWCSSTREKTAFKLLTINLKTSPKYFDYFSLLNHQGIINNEFMNSINKIETKMDKCN